MGNFTTKKDNELIISFKRNDETVLKNLYLKVYPKAKTYVLKNSGNEEQAKDIFQEAFIVCWKNIKDNKVMEDSNVEAYLFTIARNKWTDYLRSAEYKRKTSSGGLINSDTIEENDMGKEKEEDVLRIALTRIGENCLKLLSMFYFEQKSMAEISEELNVASSSARNQKYRCMERLRIISLELMQNE